MFFIFPKDYGNNVTSTPQKLKFFIEDFFSKYD